MCLFSACCCWITCCFSSFFLVSIISLKLVFFCILDIELLLDSSLCISFLIYAVQLIVPNIACNSPNLYTFIPIIFDTFTKYSNCKLLLGFCYLIHYPTPHAAAWTLSFNHYTFCLLIYHYANQDGFPTLDLTKQHTSRCEEQHIT